jgi:hypothetical protein
MCKGLGSVPSIRGIEQVAKLFSIDEGILVEHKLALHKYLITFLLYILKKYLDCTVTIFLLLELC